MIKGAYTSKKRLQTFAAFRRRFCEGSIRRILTMAKKFRNRQRLKNAENPRKTN